MKSIRNYFDLGSLSVIIITFILFFVALFTKGFTHDLLLEVGIFLVSIKLIMMSYKNTVYVNTLDRKLNETLDLLKQRKS
ncbi:MAG: hypothetical protein JRF40_09235 [Deltaproteobacteria bacterium]|nr:hypothetical protein [Deltaproteobacteria bacterium]